jgi:hypothetical protein
MAKESTARSATADAPEEQARTIVYLGNRNGIEVVPDPDADDDTTVVRRKIEGGSKKRCTTVVLAPGITLMEAAVQITDTARGVWQAHSDDQAPAWVAVDGPQADALAQLLAAHYGGIEVRDPEPDHAVTGDQEG